MSEEDKIEKLTSLLNESIALLEEASEEFGNEGMPTRHDYYLDLAHNIQNKLKELNNSGSDTK